MLAMGCFNRKETMKVGRERLRAVLNDENVASDAPRMVANRNTCDKPSLFTPSQGALAVAAIPEGGSRGSTPHIGIWLNT